MRGVFKAGIIGWDWICRRHGRRQSRVVPHRAQNCEQNTGWNRLATAFSSRTIIDGKEDQKPRMTTRIEPYRVSAYNTSKHSENKIHDDAVARRFGFSGGLVPGVDVMAYMMHLPVAKWGRAFLERGMIEARFVKPVYDGETAVVTGEEKDGVLTIAVESRGQLCATGSATLPAAAPSLLLTDFSEAAPVGERRPVDAMSYELGKWLGTVPRSWAGDAATEYLADVRETDPIFAKEGFSHPGLFERVMNK